MENQTGVEIFGNGLGLEAADFFERAPAKHAAAARIKCAVMAIAAGLHHAEE